MAPTCRAKPPTPRANQNTRRTKLALSEPRTLTSKASLLTPNPSPLRCPSGNKSPSAFAREFADLADVESTVRVVVRLLLAAALGGVLGYQREHVGKAAGLRTHMLVAIGSALFILAPREADADFTATSRVIQGLVAGIGFLGAGTILKRQHHEVEGLTTAASIWTTAAIGMTVALGQGRTAILAAAIAFVILAVLPNSRINGHGAHDHDQPREQPPSPHNRNP